MTSFRTATKKMVPSNLLGGDGERVLYSLGVVQDAFVERTKQSTLARFPEYAPTDALGSLGRDRKIYRGIGEPDASYAARLIRWLDDHRRRGNPFALLAQLRAYVQTDMRMRTVDNRGNWFTVNADGTREVQLDQGNWNWDATPASWSRFWVIMYPPATLWTQLPAIGDPSLWGGAIGTAGYTIGSTATPEQVKTVKAIVREWKPAGTRCVRIIVSFDAAAFDPAAAAPPNPDGDWNKPSNRNPNAAYWNPNHG